jgi:hypothetical protein
MRKHLRNRISSLWAEELAGTGGEMHFTYIGNTVQVIERTQSLPSYNVPRYG